MKKKDSMYEIENLNQNVQENMNQETDVQENELDDSSIEIGPETALYW